jgi:cell division protease FtsH
MMGSERRSLAMSEEEKRTTAYHEAGHALVAVLVPEADPLHKVTIIPRGMALGLTQQLPLEDRYTYSRSYLDANLRVLMGGRLAEELVFGSEHMTTGAGNDLERATELARKMVCEWGMSAKMGPLTFGKREENIFLGKEFARHQDYSQSTAVAIDEEIRRFITEAYEDSRRILDEHRDALEAIALGLLDVEVLDGEEIYTLIAEHSEVDVEAIRRHKQKDHQEVSETA